MAAFVPEGTFTALVTPMCADDDRTVDVAAIERLVAQQLAGGIDGLVACGTTGEASTLNDAEYDLVVATVVRCAAGRVPVIAGTGSNDTRRTIDTTRRAAALGVDAVLVVTPYYNKPTQTGLIQHFQAVADATDLPLILYNVPGRTACNLLPATVAELARHRRIVAVKEASGSLDQVQEILTRTQLLESFGVLSGDDALCLPVYSVGGHGVISVVSNVAPALTAALWRDYKAGRVEAAAHGQLALHPLIRTLFSEPNPQPCKAAMHLLGLMAKELRLPMLTADDATVAVLRRQMADLGLLPAVPPGQVAGRPLRPQLTQ